MHVRTFTRWSAAAAAGVVSAATLAFAPAAQAAPVFSDPDTRLDPFAYASTFNFGPGTEDCAVTSNGGAEPDVPVVENGPVASASTSVSATFVDNNNPADSGTASGSATASGRVTSAGGVLKTMDFSATSTYTLTNALATSNCYRYGWAGVDLEFKFTVTQAGFLLLNMKNTGTSYGEVYLYQSNLADEPYYDNYGSGLKFNSDSRVFLPAGTYEGYFEGSSGRNNVSGTRSGTTTVHGSFAVAGSQTAAPEGKGKKYVSFPAARNCATDSLTPSITSKAKRAKKIQSVTFFVNDKRAKKVKDPNKGQAVNLTVADDVDADVRAVVKLEKVKKGKPAKKLEVTSSYIACS